MVQDIIIDTISLKIQIFILCPTETRLSPMLRDDMGDLVFY